MKAAALLLVAVLILPALAGAVMMEPSGGVPGEGPPRVLTLDEQRALSRERARESARVVKVPPPAPVPLPSVAARRPGTTRTAPGSLLLLVCAAFAAAGALAVALRVRLRLRGAAATGKLPAAEPEGSTVESLWRMHLRRRR